MPDVQHVASLGAALVLLGYAAGCAPTAAVVGRRAGFDPRNQGSRNPGATNALRLGGRWAATAVLLGDVMKGLAPVAVAQVLAGPRLALAVGVAAVFGHLFPITQGFSGGKGVATTAGVTLVIAPVALIVTAAVFAGVVAATRVVAVASVLAAMVLPVAAMLTGTEPEAVLVLGVLALLVVARHRGNLARLRAAPSRDFPALGTSRRNHAA